MLSRDDLLATITDPEPLYDFYGVGLVRQGAQWVGYCPFHADHNRPSLSVREDGVFYCFVCGFGGSPIDLAGKLARPDKDYDRPLEAEEFATALYDLDDVLTKVLVPGYQLLAPKPADLVPTGPGPDVPVDFEAMTKDAQAWHYALIGSYGPMGGGEAALQYLLKTRLVTGEVIQRELVGYDPNDGRITVPVREWPTGRIVNVRKYQPGGTPKVISYAKGTGANRLLESSVPPGDRVVVVAGEMDWLSALSVGFDEAVTFTSGEGTVPPAEMVAGWKGKTIYIWYDNDEAGEKGAGRLAQRVAEAGATAYVLRWPDGTPAAGFDFSDLRAQHPDWTRTDLERFLVENAVQFQVAAPPAALAVPAAAMRPATKGRTYMRTDAGNGERFRSLHGGAARHAKDGKGWYLWDGKRYTPDKTGHVLNLAVSTARRIVPNEGPLIADPDDREKLVRFAASSENMPRLTAMLSAAGAMPGIAVSVEQFDADPFVLNVENGTVDLRTGQLRPPDKGDLITKLAPVPFLGLDTPAPVFEGFIDQIFLGDKELIRFMQKALGSALTGDTRDQKFFVLHGQGQNGKSTLLNAVLNILGDGEYANKMPSTTLLQKPSSAHPTDIADLKGARFAWASEPDMQQTFAEALIKELTGGEPIKARFMRQDLFSFRPEFTLFVTTNPKPNIVGADDGIWRRIALVPFKYRADPPDTALDAKLRAEYPGILAWLVRGCLLWQAEGLDLPDTVRVATTSMRAGTDPTVEFLAERCDTSDPDALTGKTELYAAYDAWRRRPDVQAPLLAKKEFEQKLEAHGLTPHRTSTKRGWLGVRLTDPDEAS